MPSTNSSFKTQSHKFQKQKICETETQLIEKHIYALPECIEICKNICANLFHTLLNCFAKHKCGNFGGVEWQMPRAKANSTWTPEYSRVISLIKINKEILNYLRN